MKSHLPQAHVHDVTKHVAYLTWWRHVTQEARFPLVSDVPYHAGMRVSEALKISISGAALWLVRYSQDYGLDDGSLEEVDVYLCSHIKKL
jgi:hypothetical protein